MQELLSTDPAIRTPLRPCVRLRHAACAHTTRRHLSTQLIADTCCIPHAQMNTTLFKPSKSSLSKSVAPRGTFSNIGRLFRCCWGRRVGLLPASRGQRLGMVLKTSAPTTKNCQAPLPRLMRLRNPDSGEGKVQHSFGDQTA